MSQWPREYRRMILKRKLFTGDPWKDGLMDTRDAFNREKAIELELNRQDREYQQQQNKSVQYYLRKLSNGS